MYSIEMYSIPALYASVFLSFLPFFFLPRCGAELVRFLFDSLPILLMVFVLTVLPIVYRMECYDSVTVKQVDSVE